MLLNFDYALVNNDYGGAYGSAIAILNPATEHWDIISCPKEDIESQNNFYHRSTLLHGEVFNCDGGQIKKYDSISQQWQVLPVSNGNNYELFAINGHLYAASGDMIFEILDGGKSTRILASARRNPPASTLDREGLGTPTLFEGPNHSLRVCTSSKIFTWTGNDWHEDSSMPPSSFQPEIFMDGVLFRQAADGLSQPMSLSLLATETNAAELCLFQKMPVPKGVISMLPPAVTPPSPNSSWEMPSNLFLANLPAAIRQSDLYLLMDHSEAVQNKVVGKDGYNAALLCFSHDLPLPQKIFLKFDDSDGCPPCDRD